MPRHLREAELVYVRRGGQGGPLAAPYNGPYQVVEKGPKFFRLYIGNQQQTVSVDRLTTIGYNYLGTTHTTYLHSNGSNNNLGHKN